ncbi:MAG: hypothetical protein ABSC48_15475 [Terracidiphilus sp.]|jgi:hypothetical protein
MEADWEFEVGGNAPEIEAYWPGFVDLRLAPERARDLPEAGQFPALAQALSKLNAAGSPVWTTKCDFWPQLAPDEFDSGELDAASDFAAHAMGCYIDLLARSEKQWALPDAVEAECKRLCGLLRAVPLRCCRADFVVRRALIEPELIGLGITAYLTSCGKTSGEAALTLQLALAAFRDALYGESTLK